jgi:hypothetical protein
LQGRKNVSIAGARQVEWTLIAIVAVVVVVIVAMFVSAVNRERRK